MGQVECVPTTYATEIKETYFENTLSMFHFRWLCLF